MYIFLTLDEVNRKHIEYTLAMAKGKINGPGGAAERLNIRPNTLRRRMEKLGIRYGRKHRGAYRGDQTKTEGVSPLTFD